MTGANTVCEVFVNGSFVGRHINGYSMFRFEITEFLREGNNMLELTVDNSADELLYPQMADFTFYGVRLCHRLSVLRRTLPRRQYRHRRCADAFCAA